VTANPCTTCAALHLEDGSLISGYQTSRPSSNGAIVRFTFGSVMNISDFNSLATMFIDQGSGPGSPGSAVTATSNGVPSLPGQAPINTPAADQSGFNTGPTLNACAVNDGSATANYGFTGDYGPLNPQSGHSIENAFTLVYNDGSTAASRGFAPSGMTFTGPNSVQIQWNPTDLIGAVGCALITDGAVQDFRGEPSLGPQAMGIGSGSTPGTTTATSTVSTTSTGTSTVTSTSTSTRTSTKTSTTKRGACPKGKHKSGGKCVKNKKKKKKCPKGKHKSKGKCVKNKKKKKHKK
jgi:hypothetical protein